MIAGNVEAERPGLRVNRAAEMEAFDALPEALRNALRLMPNNHSALELTILRERVSDRDLIDRLRAAYRAAKREHRLATAC